MIIPTLNNYTDKILKDTAVAPYQSSIAVDSGFEESSFQGVKLADGSVTSAKISSISWDKGYGGTLTLGGASNVSGVLSVKDASAVEKVRLDNTGITVNTGKITIKDDADTTMIDSKGLVSTANFDSGSVENTGQRDITSTTMVDVPYTSITTSSFPRTVKVLVIMNVRASLYLPDTDEIQWGEVVLNVDGTNKFSTIFDQTIQDTRMYTSSVFSFDSRDYSLTGAGILSLGSGTHTFKIQAKVGGQTLRILSTSVIYVVLGK